MRAFVGLQTVVVLFGLAAWCALDDCCGLVWACRLVWAFMGLQSCVGLCVIADWCGLAH